MNRVLLTLAVAASALTARADVKMPAIFSDHMVVQAGVPVAVWGWADAGEEVTVTFAGQTKTAKAGADRRWSVKLDAIPASGEAREMTVSSANQKSEPSEARQPRAEAGQIRNQKLHDLLVGEV